MMPAIATAFRGCVGSGRLPVCGIGFLCASLLSISCAPAAAPQAKATPSVVPAPTAPASASSVAPGCAVPAILPEASPSTAPEPNQPEQVQATVPIEFGPNWSATAFGSVWVAAHRSNVLYRIDPATNKIVASIPITFPIGHVGFGPIFVGPHGVWAPAGIGSDPDAGGSAPNQLFHIDPATNKVDRVFATPDGGAMIDTPEGIWTVIDPSSDPGHAAGARKSLLERDPVTEKVLRTIDLGPASASPRYTADIASGIGSLWVVVDDRHVARVDLNSGSVVATVTTPATNVGYGTLAFVAGRLFVAQGDTTVARVDPATNCVDGVVYLGHQLAPQRGNPMPGQVGLTAAPEGLYVGFDRGALALVAPVTLKVTASLRVDEQDGQTRSTWGFGSLWYPTLVNNSVIRVKALG